MKSRNNTMKEYVIYIADTNQIFSVHLSERIARFARKTWPKVKPLKYRTRVFLGEL